MALNNMVTNRTAPVPYNAADLNRVESAVSELVARLNAAGYLVVAPTKTDWTTADTQTQFDMERYRQNVAKIRDALAVMESTPPAPESMCRLDWPKANDIEKILLDVELLIDNTQNAYRHSGTFCAGQGGLIR